jgi:lipopolysaccharide biosynthesis glycosyltransferase
MPLNTVKELWELDLQGTPSACVYRPDIGWIGGHFYDDMASGIFFCDCEKWNELKLTEACFDLMKEKLSGKVAREFHVNVESVMSYIHQGKFLHLPAIYQNLTYYGELIKLDRIAHFAGPKPWTIPGYVPLRPSPRINYKRLWTGYHNNDKNEVLTCLTALPDTRSSNPWKRDKRY